MTALFFWVFSIGMLGFALAVVFNRNAVASALCFTFSIIFMAGLFVMLSAFFLAAVQILVTAGAVMVLFLFIIMLLDLSAMEHAPRHKVWMVVSGLLALAFMGLVGKVLAATPPVLNSGGQATMTFQGHIPGRPLTQSDWDRGDDTHRIGRLLFATNVGPGQTSYVAPFEITSLLILVATIGVIVLCKHDEKPRPRRREDITREAPPARGEVESALRN